MGRIYWLASYPKSGNTWFRVFLSNLKADADKPVSINELNTGAIASGRGWIDEVMGFDSADLDHDEIDRLRPVVYEWSQGSGEPGHHKIHDAFVYSSENKPLFAGEAVLGVLYIIRNPLDIAPSLANHNHTSIDVAIQRMADPMHALAASPRKLNTQVRQIQLSWSQHVLSWVDNPEIPVEVIRYEDMLRRPRETFRRAVEFLQLEREEQKIAQAIRFSEFDELAGQEREVLFREKPPGADAFFRQGKSGDWRESLTPLQVSRIVDDHRKVMRRFGYLDASGGPFQV